MPVGKPYIVMVQRPGDFMRKLGRYENPAEAYRVASSVSGEGWCAAVHLFFVPHQQVSIGGWQLVATFADGRTVDESTRYLIDQGMAYPLPPPSPADDLGEEVGP